MKKEFLTPLLVLACVFSSVTFAQNWIGNVSADWNNASNWSSPPSNGSNLTIGVGGSFQPIISSNSAFSPATIIVQNGGVLTIGANLTTSDDVECIGVNSQIIMNAGNVSINPGGGGRLIIDLGSTMNVNGGNLIVDERLISGQDALVTISNGVVTSGERVLMDLGGRFIQDGGTLNVAQTFAAADGSGLNNSGYTLNNGILNVTGEMAFENEAGNFEPYFIQNGGSLMVNGDIVWFGATPGSGTPRFITNAGQTTVSGLVHNLVGSSVNMYLRIGGTSTFTMNGSLMESVNVTDSILQTGGTFIWNNVNQVANEGVFFVSDSSTIINGSTSLTGAGSYQFHNLKIEMGATLNHINPSQLAISGDLNHDGSFVANQNWVIFNGSSNQLISGTNDVNFFNLRAQNSSISGIDLGVQIVIINALELINGKLNSSSLSLLKLLDNATSTSGNQNSFVNGPLLKVGDDAFEFPIGKNNRWRRMAISAPSNINDEFIAEYFDNSFSSITPVNSPLSAVSNLEYWNLSQLVGNASVTINLFWEDAAQSAITDCNDLTIASWDGSSWNNIFSTSQGVCSGNGNGTILSSTAMMNWGTITFGFFSGVTTQNITLCQGDTILVGSSSYFASGTYLDYLLDQNMNDSIVITALTVLEPQFSVITYEICKGEQVTVGANTYSIPGIYLDTLQSINGCDSIVESTILFTLPDTLVTLSGVTLASSNVNASAYTWVDCNDNFAVIPGQNQSSYTASANGSYALIVTESGCVDTSACYSITTVKLNEQDNDVFSVYPNPSRGIFNLTFNPAHSYGTIHVLTILGELLQVQSADNRTKMEINIEQEPGVYLVQLVDEEQKRLFSIRVIKE